MKNALASLLIISLMLSLGMNYSLRQRWQAWAQKKTAWINNEWAWQVRERHEANRLSDMENEVSAELAYHQRWLDKADTYLREEKQEKELRTRRAAAVDKLRDAGIE